MLRKIAVAFTTLNLLFVSSPSFAGEDWGWSNGLRYHPKYYVMNVENEGFFHSSCWPAEEADENWKLQVKLSGKNLNGKQYLLLHLFLNDMTFKHLCGEIGISDAKMTPQAQLF